MSLHHSLIETRRCLASYFYDAILDSNMEELVAQLLERSAVCLSFCIRRCRPAAACSILLVICFTVVQLNLVPLWEPSDYGIGFLPSAGQQTPVLSVPQATPLDDQPAPKTPQIINQDDAAVPDTSHHTPLEGTAPLETPHSDTAQVDLPPMEKPQIDTPQLGAPQIDTSPLERPQHIAPDLTKPESEPEPQSSTADFLSLPSEYQHVPNQAPFCAERFGVRYLQNLGKTSINYCDDDSASTLTCFHNQIDAEGRVDSFCAGGLATISGGHGGGKNVKLDCRPKELTWQQVTAGVPRLEDFPL